MMKYRPDIDGLRAIAVGSVVLFHLDEKLLSGGFVGVDIFFVISGYLITNLIFKELITHGEFKFARFYARRIRRLFPALFVTLLLSFIAACWLFSPPHLVELAKSLISAVVSISNVYFWSIAGYFDSGSQLKPLLHTWSLSIEEQFYMFWPALLVMLFSLGNKNNKKWLIPIFIAVVGFISLLLNQWFFSEQATISSWFSQKDNQSALDVPSTVFYLLPFRVFEFSIGAILVWIKPLTTNDNTKLQKSGLAELSFLLGLLMVIYSIVVFNAATEFPSTAALLPCFGAALMIAAGSSHKLVRCVSNRAMVKLGLISYSLYLVHWPIIVFYKYLDQDRLHTEDKLAIILISLLLATALHRLIEQPFRQSKISADTQTYSPNRRFLIGTVLSSALMIVLMVSAISSKGWLWRYPASVAEQLSYSRSDYTEHFWDNLKALDKGFSINGKAKVIIIGDSMAADLVNVLVAGNADEAIDLVSIAISDNCMGISPLNDVAYTGLYGSHADTCRVQHQKFIQLSARLKQADTVVLASYWWDPRYHKYLIRTVNYLKSIGVPQVMVQGMKNQQSDGIPFFAKHAFSPNLTTMRTPLNAHTYEINKQLQWHAKEYEYFDLLSQFCNDDGCLRVTKDHYLIIFDGAHLSEAGAKMVGHNIQSTDWFQRLKMITQ